jgi:predicted MPP superfamily phosphohydrolase
LKGWGYAAAAAGAAAAFACMVSRHAALCRYQLASDRLQEGERLLLVYLSDLHSEPDAGRRRHIRELIRQAKPDIILLGGDIYDGRRPDGKTSAFLCRLRDIAPVYAAMGNHECRNPRLRFLRGEMRRCGITLLQDEYICLPGGEGHSPLWLGGIEDREAPQFYGRCHWETRMREIFSPLGEKNGLRILLSHRPFSEVYRELPVDLIFSGHAHGGQVHLPGLSGGVYAPDEGLFPARAGGMYRYGEKTHIVGRGASCFFFPPRVNNPPEVVAVEVCGKRQAG